MDMVGELSRILSEKTCIVGMGNYYRNDDAAGLYVIDGLKNSIMKPGLDIVNVEDVLESYIFFISEKSINNVLIIDAVMADCDPGTVVFGNVKDLEDITRTVSSHKMSLDVACRIFGESGKNTYLLGIAAENIDFGTKITDEVKHTADLLLNLIKGIIADSVCENIEVKTIPRDFMMEKGTAVQAKITAKPVVHTKQDKRSM
jgi:hydrogenase 3 maturation protease